MTRTTQKREIRNRRHNPAARSAFSLVEVVLAILILSILVTGALSYHYHSSRNVHKSEVEAVAGRLALLLLEGWKGASDPDTYDPVTQLGAELTIATSPFGPGEGVSHSGLGFNLLGHYHVLTNDVDYYVTLSWQIENLLEPRLFHVNIVWRDDYQAGPLLGTEDTFRLTTYAQNY